MIKKENKIGNIIFLGKKRKFEDKKIIKKVKNKEKPSYKINFKKSSELKDNTKIINRNRIGISLNIESKKLIKNNKTVKDLFEFKESNIIRATEEDFKNPIAFFDELLLQKDIYSGVIKIIPPKDWKQNYDILFEKYYKKRFLEKEFKLEVRMQNLGNLLLGKVKLKY